MKRYKLNVGIKGNKTVWEYRGKVEAQDWDSLYERYKRLSGKFFIGIRITDIETKEVIFEKLA